MSIKIAYTKTTEQNTSHGQNVHTENNTKNSKNLKNNGIDVVIVPSLITNIIARFLTLPSCHLPCCLNHLIYANAHRVRKRNRQSPGVMTSLCYMDVSQN